eukprot:10446856-Alexandrium_andersonii.AAC.1
MIQEGVTVHLRAAEDSHAATEKATLLLDGVEPPLPVLLLQKAEDVRPVVEILLLRSMARLDAADRPARGGH